MSANEAREYGVIDMIVGQTEATAAADRAEALVNEAPTENVTPSSSNGKK